MANFNRIKRDYTMITKLGGLYFPQLIVGVQGFSIAECDTCKEAVWWRNQLVKALKRMIDNES